ncbi:MAG: glycerol-3-phosphate 1-O-acyltransferase PlsY [Candidatus Omnitrophica bacterium]|nr:glycerol-3-phosphate 1-O-acyltransferase PlsY [Candidatus Omnitrophota bacterium]
MEGLGLLACYLLGSIPSAYWLVKWVKRIDIRTVGSGNVGATNALRAAGPWAGTTVLVVDVAKGLLATALLPRWFLAQPTPAWVLAYGVAAVIGHVFPCFLSFRGGKGVATTLGALAGSLPLLASLVLGVWLIVFTACRYVSVASMASAAAIPLAQAALHRSSAEVLLGASLALLIVARHRTNLQRLVRGAEPRAWMGKQD